MSDPTPRFSDLGLSPTLLDVLTQLGYESPTPIQEASIPPLLAGQDVLGQAQTGTGKTAAFALPALSRLDPDNRQVQVLVLTPTRELAIQVAEAFQAYAKGMPDFHVLPIYGGQSYSIQLKHLKRGVQVVVGTPGRIMDHMRRKTLKLDGIKTLVLDEADEMLRMGFIDDVDWILGHAPAERQIALFSATMPKEVKKVAVNHLRHPVDIKIKTKTSTATNINQSYWSVSGMKKTEALSRLLEVEEHEGVMIFVRTKMATEELAEKLQARGFAAEALNGDMVQKQRERLVAKLKSGAIDILIGTDVVARGLDVERITHVINYDIPYDTESYVHRIGRTGRAGREGKAILFVTRREQRMLRMIEKATKQPIDTYQMPSVDEINDNRLQRFKSRIMATLASKDLSDYQPIIQQMVQSHEVEPEKIAAALAYMLHGDQGLFMVEQAREKNQSRETNQNEHRQPAVNQHMDPTPVPLMKHPDIEMVRFVLNAGRQHRVMPTHVVGMICNETGLDREYVGQIDIYPQVTTVDLPADMPDEILDTLWHARLCGRKTQIKAITANDADQAGFKGGKKKHKKNNKNKDPKKPRQHKRPRTARAGKKFKQNKSGRKHKK